MTEPLRVPRDVTQISGCNCGGHTYHRVDCALWDMTAEAAEEALAEASARLDRWTADLNRRLI